MAEQQKSRWVLNIILVVAVLALIGFSMLPLLNATLEVGQQPSPTPSTPIQSAPVSEEARKADLEAQVKGYEMVLQREPENITALQGVLDARLSLLNQFKVGETKSIIAPLETLAKLQPDQANYKVLLAETKANFNDPEGAAQAYRAALMSEPGNTYALAGLVSLYLKEQKPEAAIGFLQNTLAAADQAQDGQPSAVNKVSVQVLLAEVYAQLNRVPDAIATFDAAITQDSRDFRPHLGKARVLLSQSKPQDAKLAYDQAFSLAPAQYKDGIRKESEPLKALMEKPATTNSSKPAASSIPETAPSPAPGAAPSPANP